MLKLTKEEKKIIEQVTKGVNVEGLQNLINQLHTEGKNSKNNYKILENMVRSTQILCEIGILPQSRLCLLCKAASNTEYDDLKETIMEICIQNTGTILVVVV